MSAATLCDGCPTREACSRGGCAHQRLDAEWAATCERAERFWGHDKRMQAEYLRAMAVVHATRKGWLLAAHVPRLHTVVLT